jgi:hypothetical protein
MAQAEVLSHGPPVVTRSVTPIVLLTPFYPDPEPARRDELVECLSRNAANELIAEIHVFLENGVAPEFDDRKLRLVRHGCRATYRDLFDYANSELAGRRVALANADIYFGADIGRLAHCELTGRLLCLSRWDVLPDGSTWMFDHPSSQDAWIFETPIRPFPSGFHLGLPGCDNRLAWEAEQAGLLVSNPARSLRAYHLHLSGVRRYSEAERVHGSVSSVPAGFLGPPRSGPVASAAFDEEMGYAVRTLELGVSSHVNVERPFTSMPEPLVGLRFTQVVADRVTPVAIELLSDGKLYVLAGDDWYGYEGVRAWLAEHGFHELLPRAETTAGTGFEAWSLLGDAGDRFLVPTQVLLAGRHLVRRKSS